jgi:hypothetical protein
MFYGGGQTPLDAGFRDATPHLPDFHWLPFVSVGYPNAQRFDFTGLRARNSRGYGTSFTPLPIGRKAAD